MSRYKVGDRIKGYILSVEEIEKLGYRVEKLTERTGFIWHNVKDIRLDVRFEDVEKYFGTNIELTFKLKQIKDEGLCTEREIWHVIFEDTSYYLPIYGQLINTFYIDSILGKEMFEI